MKVSKGYLSFLKIKKKRKEKKSSFSRFLLTRLFPAWKIGFLESTLCYLPILLLAYCMRGQQSATNLLQYLVYVRLVSKAVFFSCDSEFMKRSAWLEDKFRWMEKKDGAFFLVKSMYQASKPRTNESFPWLLVWKSGMLPNICFFTREAIWGKIPTIGPASKKGFYPCK